MKRDKDNIGASCKLLFGVARTLVKEIPEALGGEDIVVSPDSLYKVIEVLPTGREILFSDDVWDFSECFKLMVSVNHVLDFTKVHQELKEAYKDYAVLLIDRVKIRTARSRIMNVNYAITLAMKRSGVDDPRFLSAENLCEGIGHFRYAFQKQIYTALVEFFSMMTHCGYMHCVNLSLLRETRIKIQDMGKYDKHRHHGNIPEPFFNILITMFDRVMRDEERPLDDRIAAGVLLVNSQLGLRVSEVVILRVDCVHWIVCDDGERRPYIVYQSIKAARGRNEAVGVETICTPLALKTIEYLLKLRARGRFADANDFLFRLDEPNVQGKEEQPHPSYRLNDFNIRLVRNNVPEAVLPWKGLQRRHISKAKDIYCIPSIHNYRVHFAMSLLEQGVQLTNIESMMSHSSESDTTSAYLGTAEASAEKRNRIMDIAKLPGSDELDEYFLKTITDDDE